MLLIKIINHSGVFVDQAVQVVDSLLVGLLGWGTRLAAQLALQLAWGGIRSHSAFRPFAKRGGTIAMSKGTIAMSKGTIAMSKGTIEVGKGTIAVGKGTVRLALGVTFLLVDYAFVDPVGLVPRSDCADGLVISLTILALLLISDMIVTVRLDSCNPTVLLSFDFLPHTLNYAAFIWLPPFLFLHHIFDGRSTPVWHGTSGFHCSWDDAWGGAWILDLAHQRLYSFLHFADVGHRRTHSASISPGHDRRHCQFLGRTTSQQRIPPDLTGTKVNSLNIYTASFLVLLLGIFFPSHRDNHWIFINNFRQRLIPLLLIVELTDKLSDEFMSFAVSLIEYNLFDHELGMLRIGIFSVCL